MQQSAPRKAERQSNFELLRIVAMFCVVVYHAVCALDISFPAGEMSLDRFFSNCAIVPATWAIAVRAHQRLFPCALALQPAPRAAPLGADAVLLVAPRRAGVGGGLAAQPGQRMAYGGPGLSLSYWFITCYLVFCFFMHI